MDGISNTFRGQLSGLSFPYLAAASKLVASYLIDFPSCELVSFVKKRPIFCNSNYVRDSSISCKNY